MRYVLFREITIMFDMVCVGCKYDLRLCIHFNNLGTIVVLILRTYALYRRDNRVLMLMASVSLALIGASSVSGATSQNELSLHLPFAWKWAITGQEAGVSIVYGCRWALSTDT